MRERAASRGRRAANRPLSHHGDRDGKSLDAGGAMTFLEKAPRAQATGALHSRRMRRRIRAATGPGNGGSPAQRGSSNEPAASARDGRKKRRKKRGKPMPPPDGTPPRPQDAAIARAPRSTLRTAGDLAARGLIAPDDAAAIARVAERYAIAVPPLLAETIGTAGPSDPLWRQFVPSAAELASTPEELTDPIGDESHSPVKGIVHRYRDRVLLKPQHACPVYCRFCFRREMVGPGKEALTVAELDAALAYVEAHPEVWEAILSGGEPLLLSARRLADIMGRLSAIAHLGVVRVHTRAPIATPETIDDAMIAALRIPIDRDKATFVAIHCNHARELTAPARAAIARMIDAGIPVLSQTVLLKGVNDDAATLEALFRALVRARVKPYYLHHPDLAPGTGHFRVSLARGRELVGALRGPLSGLCQPTYVLDVPGGFGKVPVGPSYVAADGAVIDPDGRPHRHPDAE
jgi:lysine 2,3-aminomutase